MQLIENRWWAGTQNFFADLKPTYISVPNNSKKTYLGKRVFISINSSVVLVNYNLKYIKVSSVFALVTKLN